MTYGAEKLIVNVLTRKADASKKRKKEIAFLLRMEGYKTQVKDMGEELTGRN